MPNNDIEKLDAIGFVGRPRMAVAASTEVAARLQGAARRLGGAF